MRAPSRRHAQSAAEKHAERLCEWHGLDPKHARPMVDCALRTMECLGLFQADDAKSRRVIDRMADDCVNR